MTMLRRLSWTSLSLLAAATVSIAASEHARLPSFTVTASNGAAVSSAALSQQPRWVLLLVSPDCKSCDRLLASLKEWQSAQLRERMVIVVRGSSAAAAAYVGTRLSADFSWYADDRDDGWRSLQVKSTPTLLGIEAGEVKWTVSGVLNDPKAVESVVRRWVEY